ncbi:hypothetical protein FACS1894158_14310 [Betaproteobacteria bacterium]|nr:hypothetical protein FACS1894158_14310 [Betaproteobacteria bacterium]
MWKLYDDLYIGIPSGISIDSVTIGKVWTTVRANNNIGIARTLALPGDPAGFARGYTGKYLRDTACHLRWDTPAAASVGVAALNAWYNTAERVKGLEGIKAAEPPDGKTAYVGMREGDAFPLPDGPDFDAAAYAGLAGYDNVVIASEALITRALPKLLDIVGENGNVILDGYSLPASSLFFAFDMPIRELRGFYPRFIDTIEACALKDIVDPAPGAFPFCIRPIKLAKIHETEEARVALNSPYKAAQFNNYFR